ncbi:hypothetical protein F5I97DRAFT_676 [Phlebopus sp. FC_14]|nr:hypothetical protein F5I97DRAFT_676 [Phlebopus sp. FC_14]
MSQVQVASPQANDRLNQSLLSLSIAAANAAPITALSLESPVRPLQVPGNSSTSKHRRLSSTGRARRRLSDARDAATRPSCVLVILAPCPKESTCLLRFLLFRCRPASLQNVASMAALSLSSPTMANSAVPTNGTRQPLPISASAKSTDDDIHPQSVDDREPSISLPAVQGVLGSNTGSVTRSGRKRGTTFTCESCSKVYRHPSCLIKHRWEHTPHWREASKFVLSKHQQVQLLEAAAILSHLSPSSASLPEDRSLWPSFLSGGLVPPPASENGAAALEGASSPPGLPTTHPISSSVPAASISSSSQSGPSGPRLHNYSVPQSASGPGGITQLRPGLLGVPTVSSSATSSSPSPNGRSSPLPVPPATATNDDAHNLLALRSASVKSESWGSPRSLGAYHDVSSYPTGRYQLYAPASLENSWSLPRSSLRSKSSSSHSHSRSASESKSDDDEGEGEGEGELVDVDDAMSASRRLPRVYGVNGPRFGWKMEDAEDGLSVREEDEEDEDGKGVKPADEWDGMEMDMEMD